MSKKKKQYKVFTLVSGLDKYRAKTLSRSKKFSLSFHVQFSDLVCNLNTVLVSILRVSGSNNICDHSTGREIVSLEITFTLHYLIAHNANAIPAANKNNNCILVYIINTSNNNNNIYIYIFWGRKVNLQCFVILKFLL